MKTSTCSAWLLLLCLLTVGGCDEKVVGHSGHNVTLPCKYDVKNHGKLHICWGRGPIQNYGCNDQIIATDGNKVTGQKSSRYQLLGNLDMGDVSLTILNATQSDSGQYGCRLQVSGWFNDKKHHIDLTIETAPEPTKITDSVTSTEQTPSTHMQADHMNSTEDWLTSGPHAVHDEEEESSSHLPVLVCVLVVVVALVTVIGLIIIASRWRIFNKVLQIPQESRSSVRFSSSTSSLRLHSRSSAVENIYQIEGTNDYEACP